MKRSLKKWAHRDPANEKHAPALARRCAKAEAEAAARLLPKTPKAKKPTAVSPKPRRARSIRRAKARDREAYLARVRVAQDFAASPAGLKAAARREAERMARVEALRANVPNWANQGLVYNKGRGVWTKKSTTREDARRVRQAEQRAWSR